MLKTLTFSVSLALALGACGVSFAGGHHNDGCATCGIASPQGSPQSVVASSQCDGGCDTCAAPAKKCWSLPKFNMPKCSLPKLSLPKCTTSYEWVLKKKKSWSWGHGAAPAACDTCGEAVVPSSQAAPSAQAPYAAPQAAPKAAPVAYPAGQHAFAAPGEMRPALAADEVPPAPTIATHSSVLQLTPAGN